MWGVTWSCFCPQWRDFLGRADRECLERKWCEDPARAAAVLMADAVARHCSMCCDALYRQWDGIV